MRNVLLFVTMTLLTMTNSYAAAPLPLDSDMAKWEKLGSKVVDFKLDRDVIRVGLRDGRFTKLKVVVTGGSLNMHRMVVEFANGDKQTLDVRHHFTPRSGTRILDLDGGKRVIKDVTFIYDSKNRPAGRATVHLFGRH